MDREARTHRELGAFFDGAPIGMAQVDAGGNLARFNPAFARLFDLDEHRGRSPSSGEIAPVIEISSRDILRSESGGTGLFGKTLTLDTATGPRSVDVLVWPSKRGPNPVANLVVIEEPLDASLSTLTEAVDRARAARDIHDGLAQDLWLAKLAAAGLDANPSLDDDARALCGDLRRAIEAALGETRNVVTAMRALDVPMPSLAELLKRHVDEFSDRFGIRVECDVDEAPRVQPRHAIELLRVVQEALNNVRKHALPGRAIVRLREHRGSIVLQVRDDGIGFDPSIESAGYGRQSMHERAQSIGGRLTIASTPGRGTTVSLRVPIAQPGHRP